MQIVIDIPKYVIDDMKECGFIPEEDNEELCKAIDNGTVLPKHGDLVDRSEIEVEEDVYNQTYIIHAPTILEANK